MSYTPSILFATVDTLPGANYQVLGMVSGATRTVSGNADLSGAYKDMESEAQRMGAHAVIGIRTACAPTNGLGGAQMLTVLTGSAIKFLS